MARSYSPLMFRRKFFRIFSSLLLSLFLLSHAWAGKNFDGADDLVNLGNPSSLNNVNVFTYTAWIFAQGWGGGTFGRILDKTNKILLLKNNVDPLETFQLTIVRAASTAEAIAVANTLSLNKWWFVVGTYDGTDGPRLYVGDIDSAPSQVTYSSRVIASGAESDESASNAFVGNRSGADRGFLGFIAHFSWWDQVLTTDQMNLLRIQPFAPRHRFSVGGTVVNLKGYWPLWESAAATALDHSGNGNNGTVTGTTVAEGPPFAK